MKIPLRTLRKGTNQWSDSCEPTTLDLDPEKFGQPVTVHLTVDKRIGKVQISLAAQTKGDFLCDRCGEPFLRDVVGSASVLFIQRDQPLPDEMPGDEVRTFITEQDELDVSTEIRDALILSLQMKTLCRADCKGLCSGCGANLNFEECTCSG